MAMKRLWVRLGAATGVVVLGSAAAYFGIQNAGQASVPEEPLQVAAAPVDKELPAPVPLGETNADVGQPRTQGAELGLPAPGTVMRGNDGAAGSGPTQRLSYDELPPTQPPSGPVGGLRPPASSPATASIGDGGSESGDEFQPASDKYAPAGYAPAENQPGYRPQDPYQPGANEQAQVTGQFQSGAE